MAQSQVSLVGSCAQLIKALDEHVQPNAHIPINGVVRKASEVTSILQAYIDKCAALATVRAEEKIALGEVAEAEADQRAIALGVAAWVKAQFGEGSKEAIAFGVAKKPRAARPSADKARSARLALATREARGTMSRKQKAKIKGSLPAIEVTIGAPAAAAPPGNNGVVAHS